MRRDAFTDTIRSKQSSPRWIWGILIGLVLTHIGLGSASVIVDSVGLSDLLATLAGIAAGLAAAISVIRLYQIYAVRRSKTDEYRS
jgi:hypothetical protein